MTAPSAAQQDAHTSAATTPVVPPASRTLLHAALFFILADLLFGGFGTAFVFAHFGLLGVLLFMMGWQVASTLAYVWNVYRFDRNVLYAVRAYRWAISGLLLSLLGAGLLAWPCTRAGSCQSLPLAATLCLTLLGGASRGVAFSARTWLELQHTQGAHRERYLFRAEAAGTALKVLVPLACAALLSQAADSLPALFVVASLAGLVALWTAMKADIPSRLARPVDPWRLLLSRNYWTTAPFYLLDGAGHALRTALFVSGAMAVIGSAAKYGLVETGASVCAACLLWWQSRHPAQSPSLKKLAASQALLAAAWIALLAALEWPLLLPVFVACYALSHPLITVVKSSLTLKGLAQQGAPAQDNQIARMMLLTAGRLSALGLAVLVSLAAVNSTAQLVGAVALATLTLPAEYLFARRLAHNR